MKILVLENVLFSRGGQEKSLLDVCEGLSSRGHSIDLMYRTGGVLESRYRKFCSRMIRVKSYSIERRDPFAFMDWLASSWKGIHIKPDIVYANQYHDSLCAGLISRITGAPFICHLRLPPPSLLCTQYRIGMSRVSHMIAVSENTRALWVKFGFSKDKISVVHNGIDVKSYAAVTDPKIIRKQFNIPENTFVVTYAGRLGAAKGLGVLLKAFVSARQKEPRLHLVICGRSGEKVNVDGSIREYLDYFKSQGQLLGIGEHITYIEHTEEIPYLFGASDLVVLPSLWPEPFGRILIESMACGTPAVGSRVGGIPEILFGEAKSFLCEPNDESELAALLGRYANWRAEDPSLGMRCRQHVAEHFNLETMVKGVEEVFLKTVK